MGRAVLGWLTGAIWYLRHARRRLIDIERRLR